MKIIIDSSRIAVFFESQGALELGEDGCWIGTGFNPAFNTSNSTLVDVLPPDLLIPNCFRLDNDQWTVVNEEAVTYQRQLLMQVEVAAVAKQRQDAYSKEADPLFFKSQRGQSSREEWLLKISEIKIRYPMPDEPTSDEQIPVTEL